MMTRHTHIEADRAVWAAVARLLMAIGAAATSMTLVIVVVGLLGHRMASADPTDHNIERNLQAIHEARPGGQATPVIRNWDCGCPEPNLRPRASTDAERFQAMQDWPHGFPTRCLYENHSSVLSQREWRPVNDRGVGYPAIRYPPGYPADAILPSHKRPKSYPYIPFPGWPRDRYRRDSWSDQDRRYYRWSYVDQHEGVEPALTPIAEWVDYATIKLEDFVHGWEFFQIHHILERQYGGTSVSANLVPIYSLPNSYVGGSQRPNLHNEFTQWWRHITVDADLLNCQACIESLPDSNQRNMTISLIAALKECSDGKWGRRTCRFLAVATRSMGDDGDSE